jgi:phenylacetic acid degradation operon negative regulatory protein
MSGKAQSIAEWIKRYLVEEEPKSKSLIVSVLGDSVAPSVAPNTRGIWLGDLIDLLAPFGISERLVRTSSFRLIEEDWLEARRDGRRSFYSLTASGSARISLAYERVYKPPGVEWDGEWTIVFLPRSGEPGSDRIELRKELEWEGFASPTPGVMLHPTANYHLLRQIIKSIGLTDRVVAMRARTFDGFPADSINAQLANCWDLSDVKARYTGFIERFAPLREKLVRAGITAQQAFVIQTLLIHSFRRATLHDPRLPTSMLPAGWPGLSAYTLCRDIYQRTYRLAQAHLRSTADMVEFDESPAKIGILIEQRFGGLIDPTLIA